MKLKLYLLLIIYQKNRGFTLLELLAASMMTIFVVLAAGYGTMVVMKENTASSVASDTQYNLNRAVDYITDEVKSATSIFTTFPTNSSDSNYTQCNVSPYAPILGIKSGSSAIVYCLKQTTNADVWLGKNVIYRAEGSTGSPQALIDLIADTPQSSACQNSGWTKIPTTPKGFFVCVNSTGKMVELHLSASAVDIHSSKAQTTSWMGSDTNTRFGDKATYEVVTQVYARAPSDVSVSVSPATISATAANGTAITFTIRRAGDVSQSISVPYSLSGTTGSFSVGTPTSPLTLTGSTPVTVTVTKTGTLASGNSLTLTLGSGTGYAIGTGSATVTVP